MTALLELLAAYFIGHPDELLSIAVGAALMLLWAVLFVLFVVGVIRREFVP